MNDFKKIAKVLKKESSFIIASHYNPEADAIGSIIALGVALVSMGKKVKLYNRDGIPVTLKFLPGANKVKDVIKVGESYDVGIIMDCAKRDRVSEEFSKFKGMKKIVIIDHHKTNEERGDFNLIFPDASAAGEVVYKLLRELKVKITPEIATNLYCAIMVDTGSFRYSNTTSDAMRIAAELVDYGAKPAYIAGWIYDNFPLARMELLKDALKSMEVIMEGRVASILISKEMLKNSGASVDLTEGLINYPRMIDTVKAAIKFQEAGENEYRISLRSKDDVDVSAIAAKFGGGGHQRAAGCTINGTLSEVKKKVYDAVEKTLNTKS